MRVHSSPTLSPFRGWAQDRVSSATALILEDGLPPVMLTLTPIALRRPTHRPAGLCELLPPLAERVRLKPLFGWHRQRLQQSCLRLPRFTGFHRPAGQREPNSADMARCQPFSTTLSGRRNAATMPCFPPARGTCSTRRTVRVPVRLGFRRPLGCRSPTAGFPASQLALRGVTVPWLSRRKVARPPAGNAETHCHACERLIALTPADYSLPSRLTASFRGHGCYTVLSPRGLPPSPLG